MNANSGGAFDPFGLNNSAANQMGGMGGMNQMGNTINSMNGMNGMNGMSGMGQMSNTSPYGNNANQFVSQPNLATNLLDSSVGMGGANPFGQSTAALGMPSTSNAFSSMTQQTQSTNINSLGTNAFDGASGAFGNAFDGGNAAKPLPFGVNPSDANSRLAEIARNSDKIDPFASLALGSNTSAQANPFGSATNTTSSFAGMTGGSSLVDLSPAALTTSSSTQQFGQVSRNPFATGGSSAAMTPTGRQPSMNQLMSAGNQQSSMMAPQQNMGMGNMGMNNMGNMNMMGGGGFNAQPQQQQQQHQFNPFAQQQQAPANQNNLFGL
ncbi:hypothetical protein FBU59_003842 [Linderina macrospora]|uniref:Uncharacterized protein n=1 Tax=Linderina macrospora TaxID=4868 RepID=A0ACC1J7H4_9FUNG|nr:hypothetical protein FBU59_003842 [Linderina macrospora]